MFLSLAFEGHLYSWWDSLSAESMSKEKHFTYVSRAFIQNSVSHEVPWFLVSLISYWYFSHVQKPINLYQQDGDVSITWPNSKMSLQVGLILGTTASTRQHQGWIKQNNKTKQPRWSARYIWIIKWNWIFWGPFPCTPSLCSSGAVLRPYRQAWTAVQSTAGS